MKKLMLIGALLVSHSTMAAQCRVDIKNEIHLDGDKVEIHQASGDKAVLEKDTLQIDGQWIALSPEQKAAINRYRESMSAYLPKAQQLASEGMELANSIIDDIAVSLDAPNSFDNVKASMQRFFADVQARYYKDGDLIIPAETFEQMSAEWARDFERAKQVFNDEFITSAFNAMSGKMKEDGGLNLTELADNMNALKAKVESKVREHSATLEKQGQEFCDSLDDMASQEQSLHEKVPELKNYQVFSI